MAGKDVTIRVQALDGTWQTIGGESARGVYPEGVVLEADQWGSSAASFNLRRDPRAFWPDITAFTPVEVDVASTKVWSGRVKETPSQVAQRVMNVQCEGWQFHLDDDLYQRTYVHDKLTDWKSAASVLAQDLNVYTTAGRVQSGEGAIVLGWENGAILPTNCRVGVTLDLGPGNSAGGTSVLLQGVTGAANSGATLFVRAHSSPGEQTSSSRSDAGSIALSTLGTLPGVIRGAFGDPYRYVTIFLYAPAGVTLNGDVSVQVQFARIFTDDAFRIPGGDTSVLRASTVVRDALSRATVLLSSDLTGIEDTSFDISSYVPDWKTPRQAWSAVDAYHDRMKKIDVDRRPVYEAKPSRPIFEVGPWSAINDDDASANSGAEIYNRAAGVAQAPDGSPVIADGLQTGEVLDYTGIDQIPNPSADANTASWTVAAGSLIRATATFESSPACFEIRTSGAGTFDVSAAASAQLKPSRKYRLKFALLPEGIPGDQATVSITTTPSNRTYSLHFPDLWVTGGTAWAPQVIDWLQPADVADTGYTISVTGTGFPFAEPLMVDSFEVGQIVSTLPDRRGFNRTMQLPIGNTLPSDGVALRAIGGIWLNAHKTTPFRGDNTLVGDESVREILTGKPVGLETLLINTEQLMRFSDRPDPDTAGHARDGRLARVVYTPAADAAVVTIDSSRTSFEAMAARLFVIQGG